MYESNGVTLDSKECVNLKTIWRPSAPICVLFCNGRGGENTFVLSVSNFPSVDHEIKKLAISSPSTQISRKIFIVSRNSNGNCNKSGNGHVTAVATTVPSCAPPKICLTVPSVNDANTPNCVVL